MKESKKIVLAEDNSVLSLLLKYKLEKEGYTLLMAKNGKEALELIELNNPKIILTDIMMPFVSGLEIISHVRNKLNLSTPIIVFSSSGQEEMVLNAFNIGATDFMSKPFSPNELIIRIKKLSFNTTKFDKTW
jgi:DNA-binding response OmpR family regulator